MSTCYRVFFWVFVFVSSFSLLPAMCPLHLSFLSQMMQAFIPDVHNTSLGWFCLGMSGSCCQMCMPAGTFKIWFALVLIFDALQVATDAHASIDLVRALSQDPDRASPSSALAPSAPMAHPTPSCLEPSLPAQAVIRVNANYVGCKRVHGLPLHPTSPATMIFTISDNLQDCVNIKIHWFVYQLLRT